mgnify:CR=1 FL=1
MEVSSQRLGFLLPEGEKDSETRRGKAEPMLKLVEGVGCRSEHPVPLTQVRLSLTPFGKSYYPSPPRGEGGMEQTSHA